MYLSLVISKLVDIKPYYARLKSALLFLLSLAILVTSNSAWSIDYTYDANGNRVSSPTHTFAYDDANRLREVRLKGSNSLLIDYLYDYEGNLIRKTQEGITTYYVSKNYHYSTGAKGELEDVYIFAGNSRVASIRNGEIKYHHQNHIGSTDTTTNRVGELTEQLDYAPYGKLLSNPHPEADYTFTGKELHKNTGYIDLGARQYDPETRQFLQPDTVAPIQIDQIRAGPQARPSVYDTIQISPYSYAKNNPVKYVDPDGNFVETVWDVANIGIGVASFSANIHSGNYGAASVDALGLVIDGAATLVPGIPGGASAAIKASRSTKYLDELNSNPIQKPDFSVTPEGVAIPHDPDRLKNNLDAMDFQNTSKDTSQKFIGEDIQGPMRVRIERGHPNDPGFKGKPDPLHTVDHLHIDRRGNGTTGPWQSKDKIEYEWPYN